jgi:MFS family permease
MLACLTLVLMFNYSDRLALGLMLQDIKIDLRLSDTRLGLLSGIAFAAFYALMGIPMARWADRGNRAKLIKITVTLWSMMVSLCGLAASFAQLLLFRIGVAVGEAGCIPPAHSLIAENFERQERARAMAIYMLGAPLSFFVGYFLAGWLNQMVGWRLTFVLMGVPGLVLLLLVRLYVDEPRAKSGEHEQPSVQTSLVEACLTLWHSRSFRHLLIGFSVLIFFGYGILNWQPSYFAREFKVGTGIIGTWFGLINGLGGLIGTYVGGELAARWAANNERMQLLGMAGLCVIVGIVAAAVYITPSFTAALALMFCYWVLINLLNGPLFSVIQTVVPSRMRATSIALIYLFANLIGMGLGPLLVGVLSDLFSPHFGIHSLRLALLCLCPGYLWATYHLLTAAGSIDKDISWAIASDRSEGVKGGAVI